MVYRSMMKSILTYDIVLWYGNLTIKHKIIKEANKITGQKQNTLQDLFSHFMEKGQLQ